MSRSKRTGIEKKRLKRPESAIWTKNDSLPLIAGITVCVPPLILPP